MKDAVAALFEQALDQLIANNIINSIDRKPVQIENTRDPAHGDMERRNRQYHGQLLILGKRPLLQWVLKETGPWAYKKRGKVMFQLDVDPWDLW